MFWFKDSIQNPPLVGKQILRICNALILGNDIGRPPTMSAVDCDAQLSGFGVGSGST